MSVVDNRHGLEIVTLGLHFYPEPQAEPGGSHRKLDLNAGCSPLVLCREAPGSSLGRGGRSLPVSPVARLALGPQLSVSLGKGVMS